jgi:HEAT repeat protein
MRKGLTGAGYPASVLSLTMAFGALMAALLLAGCGSKQRPPTPSEEGKAIMARIGDVERQKLVAEAFDTKSADRRRLGILQLYQEDWGRQEPCLSAYALLAQDKEPIVRAAAIVAVVESRNPAYIHVLLDALDRDKEAEYIRVDAAEGLRKVVAPTAVEPLIRHAKSDPSLDVRLRCIRALVHYPQKNVLDALLVCVGDEEFGIRFTARRTLTSLTGEDAVYDVNLWSQTLSSKSDPFVHPAAAHSGRWSLWGT